MLMLTQPLWLEAGLNFAAFRDRAGFDFDGIANEPMIAYHVQSMERAGGRFERTALGMRLSDDTSTLANGRSLCARSSGESA